MAFEEMTCPNCGAALEYKAGTPVIICKFCNTTLRLKAEIVSGQASADLNSAANPYHSLADVEQIKALLKDKRRTEAVRLYMEQTGASLKEATLAVGQIEAARSKEVLKTPAGPFAVDLDELERLIHSGQKIRAIKLLREQTGLGLKEAKDAIDTLERGKLPSLSIDQRARSGAVTKTSTGGCLLGCLPVVGMLGLCFLSIMLMSQVMFRVWGPYDEAMLVLHSSEEVVAALGEPLSTGLMMVGSISSSGVDSHARLETAIFGSKRGGTLRVSGVWRKDRWDLSIWVLYDDDDNEARTIYLSARP